MLLPSKLPRRAGEIGIEIEIETDMIGAVIETEIASSSFATGTGTATTTDTIGTAMTGIVTTETVMTDTIEIDMIATATTAIVIATVAHAAEIGLPLEARSAAGTRTASAK